MLSRTNNKVVVSDFIPGVDHRRVDALMALPSFKATSDLQSLRILIQQLSTAEPERDQMIELMNRSCHAVVEALHTAILSAGFRQDELAAAILVADGSCGLDTR